MIALFLMLSVLGAYMLDWMSHRQTEPVRVLKRIETRAAPLFYYEQVDG